jgi:hypothetical protein
MENAKYNGRYSLLICTPVEQQKCTHPSKQDISNRQFASAESMRRLSIVATAQHQAHNAKSRVFVQNLRGD